MITDQFIADVVATIKTTVEQADMSLPLKERQQQTRSAFRQIQNFCNSLSEITDSYWQNRELSDEALEAGEIIKLDPKVKDYVDKLSKLI